MALDATAGGPTSNSYATVADGDSYHANHLYAASWSSAITANKEAALIWATRLLDEQVTWKGDVETLTQALRWPRQMVLDRDGRRYLDPVTIPTFLKQATAELARHLLMGDRTQERSIGLSSVTADTVTVTFDKHDVPSILPPSVTSIVEPYGDVKGPGSGSAKLVRV